LIENEVTVPVSFLERENSFMEHSIKGGIEDWCPDFNALSCGNEQKEKKEVVDNSKNFLPSSLLEPDIKA
jgi:hypothetical protein